MDFTSPNLDWNAANLKNEWRRFVDHADIVLDGPLEEKSEAVKCKYLLMWSGDQGRALFRTWEISAANKDKLAYLKKQFNDYFSPQSNIIFARFKLYKEMQGDRTIDEFLTILKTLAKDCEYTNTEEMIRDKFVFSINSNQIRERLINEAGKLTLQKAIEIAQNYEFSKTQLKEMSTEKNKTSEDVNFKDDQMNVHAVRFKKKANSAVVRAPYTPVQPNHDSRNSGQPRSYRSSNDTRQKQYPAPSDNLTCRNCGYKHGTERPCPAYGKQCNGCGKRNHFQNMCRSTKPVHSVEPVQYDELTDEMEMFFIDNIVCESIKMETNDNSNKFINFKNNQMFCNVAVLGKSVFFKCDTGSMVNILPSYVYDEISTESDCRLNKCNMKLSSYSGDQLIIRGICSLNCKVGCKVYPTEFYVVDVGKRATAPPILGLQACLEMKLLNVGHIDSIGNDTSLSSSDLNNKKVPVPTTQNEKCVSTPLPLNIDKKYILSQFPMAFQGIGSFAGKCDIHIDKTVNPVVHPPRRIPLAIRDKLKAEIDSMVESKVICKVTEPTEWVNSLVVIEKPKTGKLRVCLDPKDLNKAIIRPHYPTRTLDDILPNLQGAKYFSKLDARSGYWGISLTEDASLLTTFNTPYGRYRFLRLPFGLNCAQDLFQRKMDENLEGLTGVECIHDDVLVHGATKAEHDENLINLLLRSAEKGIRYNADKLEISKTELDFFGHVITEDGLKADINKISAILDMKPPNNKEDLQTILGMCNYLSRFAPNLSDVTAPMRMVLGKGILFHWEEPQEQAFKKMKDIITSNPVLAYFDPEKPLTVQSDASKFGLGAIMMQEGKPLSYASCALKDSEIRYAPIEKEMYAILFACRRFHYYTYGRRVRIETDHKPLIPIFKKPINVAPARLQSMLLQLQRYDLDVVWVPGKEIPVTDCLSRQFIDWSDMNLSANIEVHIHHASICAVTYLPIKDRKIEEIKKETLLDTQICTLIETISSGWPETIHECPDNIKPYWNFRDELSVIDNLAFKSQRLIIPASLRHDILSKIHTGHMGIEKCLNRARDIVFWPGISSDVSNLVKSCTICAERSNANTKEPLQSHPIPDRPWQYLASDLLEWDGKSYIVIVDYFSRYFETALLSKINSASIIKVLKSVFSRHGIPEHFMSDNGPQYSSEEFRQFAINWNFNHITSSPHYPKSNGLVERTVQTVKNIFTKSKAAKTDPLLGILEYRTTPLKEGYSPSQLLMSRSLRSFLPTTAPLLEPKVIDKGNFKKLREEQQMKSKTYYDRNSRDLDALDVNQEVLIFLDTKKWKPGHVTRVLDNRSYIVESNDGGSYRRNRVHLKPAPLQAYMPSKTSKANVPSDVQPAPVQNDPILHISPKRNDQNSGKTRSGRSIRPPIKFGFD